MIDAVAWFLNICSNFVNNFNGSRSYIAITFKDKIYVTQFKNKLYRQKYPLKLENTVAF